MTSVSLRQVSKAFGPTQVLHGVDLEVPAARLTAVLGPSGCGKTTMLRLVAGFEDPDDGEIRFGEQVVFGPGDRVPAQRRRVGYVPQEGALFPHLSVADNVGFGLGRAGRRDGRRVDDLLELVGLGSRLRTRLPHELSGGQQQRVALARALAPSPSVVLLDEPFASLDAGLREGTGRAVVAALQATGATAILVTHDQSEALSLADRVAVMRTGRIAQVGSPEQVYAAPVDLGVARFVGAAVVLEGTVAAGVSMTALGRVPVAGSLEGGAPVAGSLEGRVQVMLRPEQLSVGAVGEDAVTAQVVGVSYYGHDCAVRLRLAGSPGMDETTLLARLSGGQAPPAVGQSVGVRVTGAARVFAAEAAPQPTASPAAQTAAEGGRVEPDAEGGRVESASASGRRLLD